MADASFGEPGFIEVGGQRLFVVWHTPTSSPCGGLVICHPLAEEKLWAHRVLVNLARDLVCDGWSVLRFDHRGSGDSDGTFESVDLQTHLEDAQAAVASLRSRLPAGSPLGLVGLRLGGTVAALAATRMAADVSALVMWEPVIDGAAYMQSVLRSNLAFQLALHKRVVHDRESLVAHMKNGESVNVEGYPLCWAFFEQVSAVDLRRDLGGLRARGLVVQIVESVHVRRECEELVRSNPLVSMASASEEPFWREIKAFYQRAEELSATTRQWLRRTS